VSVEEDLKNMGIRNWRHKLQGQEQWRTILEEIMSTKECNSRRRRRRRRRTQCFNLLLPKITTCAT